MLSAGLVAGLRERRRGLGERRGLVERARLSSGSEPEEEEEEVRWGEGSRCLAFLSRWLSFLLRVGVGERCRLVFLVWVLPICGHRARHNACFVSRGVGNGYAAP